MVDFFRMIRSLLFIPVLILLALLICLHPSYAQEERPLVDPIVIELIELDYADAEYLASVLAPLLSKEGKIVAYVPTNTLIIKDRASLVKRLREIIKGRKRNNGT
jgi:type II secretory pathway component GspD/PulD (secretin)